MKAKNLKPMIISTLLAVGFGATTVGTSFALFTDSAETNISVTSGKVKVNAALSDVHVYSAIASSTATSYKDENNASYNLVEQTEVDTSGNKLFVNQGYASINTNNNELGLVNITPGDKVTFKLSLGNESNVNIKYRFIYEAVPHGTETTASVDLIKGLETTITESGQEAEVLHGLKTYKSVWMNKAANATLDDVAFAIHLPIDKGNVYQDKHAYFKVYIEAVQGNAVTTDGKVVETIEEDLINTAKVVAGNPTVLTAKNAEESVTVKTTIPADTEDVPAGVDVKLEVSDLVSSDESSDTTIKNLDFDLSLYVGGTKVDEFKTYIPVEIDIGPGYDIASIKHKTKEILPYDATNNPHGYTYDINEGIIRFETKDFSPFTVSYRTKVVEVQEYEELRLASLQPYVYIKMLNDLEIPNVSGKGLVIASNVTIDGNGYKLETQPQATSENPFFTFCPLTLNGDGITLRNLKLYSNRTVVADGAPGASAAKAVINLNQKDKFKIENCELKGNMPNTRCFYDMKGDITILNSSITGYNNILYESSGSPIYEGKLIVDNSTIISHMYTLNIGTADGTKAYWEISNSTLGGWISFSEIAYTKFTNCTFVNSTVGKLYNVGIYFNFVRGYVPTYFNGCTFEQSTQEKYFGFATDPSNDGSAEAVNQFFDENNVIKNVDTGISETLTASNFHKIRVDANESWLDLYVNGAGLDPYNTSKEFYFKLGNTLYKSANGQSTIVE